MSREGQVPGSSPLSGRCRRLCITLLSDKELESVVNEFSEKNFIGKFQFGEVYRGIYRNDDVIVKIWKKKCRYEVRSGDNEGRLADEIILHEYFFSYEFHPNVAKLLGTCHYGKHLAAIYLLRPKAIDTLHNLIEKDTFTWAQRIKVAFGFASLLRYMHTPHPNCPSDFPYLIRNVDASHILVDQDYEALLFDFSMITGGILTDKRHLLNQYVHGCRGYSDPICDQLGEWSDRCDVFSYGVVLLSLISKRVSKEDGDSVDEPFLYEWAKNGHEQQYSSLMHPSLKSDPGFHFRDAIRITNLAMQCIEDDPKKRPTMKQVVRHLQNLHIVRQHANTWECCQMLDGVNEIFKICPDDKDDRVKEFWQPLRSRWGLVFNHFKHRMCTNKGFKSSNGEDNHELEILSYEDLSMATNNFSEGNLIVKFQFGEVFRGKMHGKAVTVKIWETIQDDGVYQRDNKGRLRDEISLLQHPQLSRHPNLMNMIGYCFEKEKLGAVYGLDPYDTLNNLAPKDEFTWLQRMKVIYEYANLLKFLHIPNPPHAPYRVGNIDAGHIILDKEYSPKLLDFGTTVGGIILCPRKSRFKYIRRRYGYIDMFEDSFYEARDIFAYGCLLLCLIHKRIPLRGEEEPFLPNTCAYKESIERIYSAKRGFSFVHKSLEREHGFSKKDGVELTKLAMECVDDNAYNRPSMKEVVKRLQNLHVIRCYAEEMGIQRMPSVKSQCCI